jgi:hypothetical protein
MKTRPDHSLGLGSLLLLGIAAAVVIGVCATSSSAKAAARQKAAKADKARWENEGGSPATPAT